MNKDSLIKLGLSQSEATLYLALFRIGASDVNRLVQETGFYKANVYQALERLCDKGIISKIIEKNRRVYQIQNPDTLIGFIDEKKDELEKQRKLAKKLTKEVELSKHSFPQETAAVFTGIGSVKKIYSDIIKNKLDYYVFGSPLESETVIQDYYWKNLHAKQHEFGIKAQMIFHKSLRHWKKFIRHKEVKIKFLDMKFEPLTETTIYGTKVALTVWTEKPVVTIINNKHVAQSYKQIFDILWKMAKT